MSQCVDLGAKWAVTKLRVQNNHSVICPIFHSFRMLPVPERVWHSDVSRLDNNGTYLMIRICIGYTALDKPVDECVKVGQIVALRCWQTSNHLNQKMSREAKLQDVI